MARPKTESDRIYNERRRAKRRLERLRKENRESGKYKGSYETEMQALSEERRLESQIQQSYKKANPEGYKGVIQNLKRDNDIDFQARENVRIDKALSKEFKKTQKAGLALEFTEQEYKDLRREGATKFSDETGEITVDVETGEVITRAERKKMRDEMWESNFKGTDIQPIEVDDSIDTRESLKGIHEFLEMNPVDSAQSKSLFMLAMKYAYEPPKDAEDANMYGSMITETQRKTFFAMIQPFRAEHPEIDMKNMYESIYNFIRVHDPNSNVTNYFDMMKYVITNPKWREMTGFMEGTYEDWLEDETWVDVDEAHYQEIAVSVAGIAQDILQANAG